MTDLAIGMLVNVTPNVNSNYLPDQYEPVWKGNIIRLNDNYVSVKPLGGKFSRSVSKGRIQIAEGNCLNG